MLVGFATGCFRLCIVSLQATHASCFICGSSWQLALSLRVAVHVLFVLALVGWLVKLLVTRYYGNKVCSSPCFPRSNQVMPPSLTRSLVASDGDSSFLCLAQCSVMASPLKHGLTQRAQLELGHIHWWLTLV